MASKFPGSTFVQATLAAALVALAGCGTDNGRPPAERTPQAGAALESAMIVGSAETPDPVLARVRELEARGLVEDVTVRESYPVQIDLRASRKVIDELEAMPRKGGLR